MQKVYVVDQFRKKLIFKSENDIEVKYVSQTLKDYYFYEKSVSVVVEEDETPRFDTFDDFLDIPEYKYHFDEIMKKK